MAKRDKQADHVSVFSSAPNLMVSSRSSAPSRADFIIDSMKSSVLLICAYNSAEKG